MRGKKQNEINNGAHTKKKKHKHKHKHKTQTTFERPYLLVYWCVGCMTFFSVVVHRNKRRRQ